MSGFIRPDLARFFSRWAEPIGAGTLAIIGALMLWRGLSHYNGMQQILGVILLLAGLGLFWAAYRRAQFNRDGDGPGLIEVTERQVTYMTPTGGGSVDLEAMNRLEVRTTLEFGRVWVLKHSEGPSLFIPISAAGSEKLFDAFSALPGLEPAKLIAAVNNPGDQRLVIWRSDPQNRALT